MHDAWSVVKLPLDFRIQNYQWNLENGGFLQDDVPFNWAIFRFQPFIFQTCAPSTKKDDDVLPEKMRPVEVLFVMPTTKGFHRFCFQLPMPRFFHMKIISLPWN